MSNIMIIDDSAVDRSLMGMLIRRSLPEVSIFEAEDGFDIIEKLLENDIRTCILDLKMPIKDGFEILKEIKSDPSVMDVPVIVCTGLHDTTSIERVLKLGAFDYFSKPLSEEVMKISLPLKVKNAIEQMNRTQSIIKLSQTDHLTGLYNRAHFKTLLANSSSEEDLPIAIIMGDINGLKIANDAYGSEVGDQCLVNVSKCLMNHCPPESIYARWGGDEFAVLIKNTNKEQANQYIETIKDSFAKCQIMGMHLGLSFGSDIVDKIEFDRFKAMSNAEDAMIRDKILESDSVRSTMIATILKTLHEKNSREEAHSRRVSELCLLMAESLQLDSKGTQDLKVIGLLHDIGKIAIDEHILNKPGRLEHDEWLEMRRHPEIGYRILSNSPEMKDYADVILYHHERLDGKGYPNGLSHMEIPYYSKILTLIDSYDAMTCERTYKKSMTDLEAVVEIRKNKGTQFDPELSEVFITQVLKRE